MSQLTPREIVGELDRYIIGQNEAKRAVAIALRNRWRRMQLDPSMRDEVMPKNILMIGPTGVGKTEIARRLARLADAPFIKVEATKFTEVGYVGKDVDTIVRDLMDVAVKQERERQMRVKRGQRCRLGQVQPRVVDIHEHGFAAQPDNGCGKGIVAGMAENDKAGGAQQFFAPLDENLAPAMRAQGRPEIGAGAGHNHAAFVKLRQCIAQRAAGCVSLFPGRFQCCNMTPVECCLGPRKTQPDQRIEQVMRVVRSRRDLTGQASPLFVGLGIGGWRHEAQGRAAARRQPALAGFGIQSG